MAQDEALERFIARWLANEGGAERANFPLFLTELCALIDLPQPEPGAASHHRNDYVFERAVTFHDEAGKSGHGRIDLYKRAGVEGRAPHRRDARRAGPARPRRRRGRPLHAPSRGLILDRLDTALLGR
ncbi:MAG: hypothetical protein EOP66_03455 [Sphingomonas sp.]|nr:MAG: hypothetical protein EOP66_03455 [Sphingomonas sp.]